MTEIASNPETKHEKFIRLRDARLPKILHAIDILSNLSQSGYECSVEEAGELVAQLDGAVDALASKFGITSPSEIMTSPSGDDDLNSEDDGDVLMNDSPPVVSPTPAAPSKPVERCPVCVARENTPDARPAQIGEDIGPGFIAEGGASAFSEISWAHDVIGKDNKLARNRLRRVIGAWKNR